MGAADLISRKGVSAWLANMGHPKLAEIVMNEKRFPPAGAKRGKWIKYGRGGRIYKCNKCGNYLDLDGVNAGRGSANFCPNCGADMR